MEKLFKICKEEFCHNKVFKKDLCEYHFNEKKCLVNGCDKLSFTTKGLCAEHGRILKGIDPNNIIMKNYISYITKCFIDGGNVIIEGVFTEESVKNLKYKTTISLNDTILDFIKSNNLKLTVESKNLSNLTTNRIIGYRFNNTNRGIVIFDLDMLLGTIISEEHKFIDEVNNKRSVLAPVRIYYENTDKSINSVNIVFDVEGPIDLLSGDMFDNIRNSIISNTEFYKVEDNVTDKEQECIHHDEESDGPDIVTRISVLEEQVSILHQTNTKIIECLDQISNIMMNNTQS